MSAVMMNPGMQAPHRKPLPTYAAQQQYAPAQEQGYTRRIPSNGTSMSSNGYSQSQQYPQPSRRTLSNATSSTSSTNTTGAGLQRAPTNSSLPGAGNAPRRSTSSRSTASGSPTSYVALMRKQKATVWCDRAQHEDPRILAAQRAAKTRAAMEVAGGHKHATQTRASTSSSGMVGGVRSKIRHHGAPKASTYTGGQHLTGGVGVPMRLSASEVDEGDSDEETGMRDAKYHSRNGSGRSSLGSGKRGYSSYLGYSNGSTPPLGHSPVESMGHLQEEEDTPVPNPYGQQSEDYFAQPGGNGGSAGSAEREERFGNVGGLPQARGRPSEADRKTSEELRRRGSVDDRTTTMSGVRLFVANPDADLSD